MNKSFIVEAFNSSQTFAAIFEDDGTTGYFYLFDPTATDGEKIKASMQIYISSMARVKEKDVKILWSKDESKVGVMINGKIWGVFDLQNQRSYQQTFVHGGEPKIPKDILRGLE